jgi:hypothetical protein
VVTPGHERHPPPIAESSSPTRLTWCGEHAAGTSQSYARRKAMGELLAAHRFAWAAQRHHGGACDRVTVTGAAELLRSATAGEPLLAAARPGPELLRRDAGRRGTFVQIHLPEVPRTELTSTERSCSIHSSLI